MKRVRCHTPCLPKVPRGRARRSRATTRERIPPGRGTKDGHLKVHHDLQATPARPGKATRLGVRGSIVPAASRTSYSTFWGGRDLFSFQQCKNGALPNDTYNTNDLGLECVARSLLMKAIQATTNAPPASLSLLLYERTASASGNERVG
uniref:Uncharacterized protein n=1 Tax=Utricularia reniformis TaxID=192314 RepID=A0A1Y0AZ22_9LAMI|nr:hypothetical protein AEK19_MT1722 [Utricularia reniformis]ART30401.1 hypothetical protein AEK19_MT1722 [Utricularia reniformis]